jgi:hypothetical protein
MEADLGAYVPRHKHDHDAVRRAAQKGFPGLDPAIPLLLSWTQDGNWPISGAVAELLVLAGAALVPHLLSVLRSEDEMWKYWILELIVRHLPPDLLRSISGELGRAAAEPTDGEKSAGVDGIAAEILKNQELYGRE